MQANQISGKQGKWTSSSKWI